MYHPTRGGVRGGRDQFNWDDVKVDKHRENYLGHSLKAPVGRWQKGKDLHWYAREKNSGSKDEALKAEIRRVKEEEEQAMREALGLAPKRANKSFTNRLDKHEYAELIKRDSTAEDLGAGHAEAAQVQGLGFARGPRSFEKPSLPLSTDTVEKTVLPAPTKVAKNDDEVSDDERSRRKRKHDRDEKRDKREKRDKYERREKRSEDKRKHRKDKEREV